MQYSSSEGRLRLDGGNSRSPLPALKTARGGGGGGGEKQQLIS
jgi:hypothetical protein